MRKNIVKITGDMKTTDESVSKNPKVGEMKKCNER